jgi:anti-sigma regulatory factor (Ser/Thr protein kinase)
MSSLERHTVDPLIDDGSARPGLSHRALLYRGLPEYLDGVTSFIEDGLAAGEAVMVAVPGPKVETIRTAVSGQGTYFVDMTELGRNPGRIIPAVQEFLQQHRDRAGRFVGEPIWSGRHPDEIAEATRHEALINVALAEAPVMILCPYDGDALAAGILDDCWRTHPEVTRAGLTELSGDYGDPAEVYNDEGWPLSSPPSGAEAREFGSDSDLSKIRSWVQQFGWAAGLPVDRVDDLVLAVSEVAGNSVRHGGGSGVLRVWGNGDGAVVCEVRDAGQITDPLVGRYAPGPDLDVDGLWLVNQLCDLVEIRSSRAGTRVRLTIAP